MRSLHALREYVTEHTEECPATSTKWLDAVDVIFFKVRPVNWAKPGELRDLLLETKGEFTDLDILDGMEHNYLDLGAWLGDQALALRLIALGKSLDLWELLTPRTMLPGLLSDEEILRMAGLGMVSMQAVKP